MRKVYFVCRIAISGLACLGAAVAVAGTKIPGSSLKPNSKSPGNSLSAVYQQVLKRNPVIQKAHALEKSAWHNIQVNRAGYLPAISLSYGIGYDHGAISPGSLNTATSTAATANLSQLIFDGGKSYFAIKRAGSIFKQSESNTDKTINEMALNTAEVYLEVLRNQRALGLAQRNMQSHQATYKRIKLRFDRGAGKKSEVELAKGRLLQAKDAYFQRKARLLNAKSDYLNVVGTMPAGLTNPVLPQNNFDVNMQAAISKAYAINPQLSASQYALKAAKLKVTEANGTLFSPSVSIVASAAHMKNMAAARNKTEDYSAMAYVNYDLFNGGSDWARKRQAVEAVVAASDDRESMRRSVENAVRTTWVDSQTDKTRVSTLSGRVASTAKVVGYYKQEFKLGRRSLLNVLDIENEYYSTQIQLVDARYDLLLNRYKLLASIGVLPYYMK